MEKKIKIGEVIEGAIEVDFEAEQEPWSKYKLTDGSTIKLRSIVTKIVRAKNKYDPDGNPIYFIKTSNIMEVTAPDKLKKR